MKQLIPIGLVLALLATAGSSLAALEAVGEVASMAQQAAEAPAEYAQAQVADAQAKADAAAALGTFLTANFAGAVNGAVALGATIVDGAAEGAADPAAILGPIGTPGAIGWADDASRRCFADQFAATQAYLGAKTGMDDVAGAFDAAAVNCRASLEYTTIAHGAADAAAASAGAEAADLAAYLAAMGPPL